MKLSIQFISKAIPEAKLFDGKSLYKINDIKKLFVPEAECNLTIDSRMMQEGDAFLALRGERADGHDFLPVAIEKNAPALFICLGEEKRLQKYLQKLPKSFFEKTLVICVPDTFEALKSLAKSWRAHFSYPVVGITGSVGKTTTKEMIAAILKYAGIPACVSYKNQNTLIGVCLTILRMCDKHKAAIFEVGISERGEMVPKVEILRPTIGVITVIAHQHMDGLGELSEIAQEKRKLFSLFKKDDIGVIFGDQELLDNVSYAHPVVRFGFKAKNQVQTSSVKIFSDENDLPKTSCLLKIYSKQAKPAQQAKLVLQAALELRTNHAGMLHNALAAASVTHLLGVPLKKIISGLESFDGFEQRFERQTLKNNSGVLIDDCYNANPESMRAALLALDGMVAKGPKVAILGDMLGLGEKELFWHEEIGRVLVKTPSIKIIILVGERARSIGKTAPDSIAIEYASDWKQAKIVLEKVLYGGGLVNTSPVNNSLVLVKASNGMGLDRLVREVVV